MNRVFAASDLHGMYDLWSQIKNYMDKTDRLYFLGDAADRGPDGVKIMQEMFADPRVIYLLGNHDQFIIDFSDQIIKNDDDIWDRTWELNGGIPTMKSIANIPSVEYKEWFISHIKKLPRFAKYINKKGQTIFMCHAGTDPDRTEFSWSQEGEKDAYIWNRRHFCTPWPADPQYQNYYIVHGHTPVQYLMERIGWVDEQYLYFYASQVDNNPNWKAEIVKYANGHKIDIDLCCFFFNRAVLLDLDTFEPIYFEGREN